MLASERSTILRVNGLKVRFVLKNETVYAVRGVSFDIKRGEVFGIVGESGSGKSVICRSVLNIIEEYAEVEGKIIFNGHEMLLLNEKALKNIYSKEIAFLPQHTTALNPLLTIGAHIEETLKVHYKKGLKKEELRARSINLLGTFGLDNPERIYRSYPYQLSGGMQQRSLMAITYSCNPLLVVADEPTIGLDIILKNQIIRTFQEIHKKFHTSMLLITHDLDTAFKLCDRVAIIYNGLLMEKGETEEVLKGKHHPYTCSLIDSIPRNGMKPNRGFIPSSLEELVGCPFQPRCPKGRDMEIHEYVQRELNQSHSVWCKDA